MKLLLKLLRLALDFGKPTTATEIVSDLAVKAEQLHQVFNHHTDQRLDKQQQIDALQAECDKHDAEAEHAAAVADKLQALIGPHQ